MLCALSGGVDSSVVAAMIHKAVGDRITCLFVDNSLLRKGEAGRMGMWVGSMIIALVPGALTINPSEVDISWDLCGHRFPIPIIAAAMDGMVSPSFAIEVTAGWARLPYDLLGKISTRVINEALTPGPGRS